MNSSAVPVSALEDHLGFWLRYVSNHVSAHFERRLAEQDISVTEWVALRTLYQAGEVSHAQLIARLGMTKGAASKIISRLESKGLAERVLAQHSARVQGLRLTGRGNRLVPVLAALADANDADYFGHLSAAQRDALKTLLQGLVQQHQWSAPPVE